MKSINVTPNSSEKSSTTTMDSSDTSQSENIDDDNNNNRCYLPKCKRDTNCNCEMCLASINATLDLISHTKLSSSIKPPRRSPVKFHPLSTPRPTHRRRVSVSPTPGTNKRNTGFGFFLVVVVVVLGLILGAEYGLSLAVSRVLKPKLSPEIVRNLGRKSWVFQDLITRVTYLNTEVNGLVGTKVSNRSSVDSMCQIIQDGLLLHSRCTLYKSASEELSIWGWPLQTAGLLTAEISSRSFTILSGRVTEWSNGELTFSIREANSSWTQGKWSSSIVQFDRNTWIIEYKRSFLIEISRFFSAGLEFLKFQTKRKFQNVKKGFWMSSAFDYLYNDNRESSFTIPT